MKEHIESEFRSIFQLKPVPKKGCARFLGTHFMHKRDKLICLFWLVNFEYYFIKQNRRTSQPKYIKDSKQPSVRGLFIKLTKLVLPCFLSFTYCIEQDKVGYLVGQ